MTSPNLLWRISMESPVYCTLNSYNAIFCAIACIKIHDRLLNEPKCFPFFFAPNVCKIRTNTASQNTISSRLEGSLSGDSGKLIQSQLTQIMAELNKTPLKVKVGIDTTTGGKKSWSGQLQQKLDQISASGKFSAQISTLKLHPELRNLSGSHIGIGSGLLDCLLCLIEFTFDFSNAFGGDCNLRSSREF